uniref:Nuclear receptor domain-containing protein n=1 Tax=Steinernema glaseri TaxID=37863 RepID=A0A1I8A9B1_9BILA
MTPGAAMQPFTSFSWESSGASPSSSDNHASSMSNCSSASPCSTVDLFPQVEACGVEKKRPLRKIKNVRKSTNLKCVVCGDRPTGYHYDVLSCNGCKTFFRRTVIANRKFICTRGGNCEFTKDFRCACRACRFQKCVQVGMNSEAIQFPMEDEDSKVNGDQLSEDEMDISAEPKSSVIKDARYEEALELLDRLLYIEDSCDRLRVSNVPLLYHETVQDVLNKPSLIESSHAYQMLHSFDDKTFPKTKRWMIMDCFLAIEYAKAFETFNNLSRSDQMALIRHVSFVITGLVQTYASYEKNLDIVTFPDGSCPLLEGPKSGISQLTVTDVALKETYRRPIEPLKRIGMTRKQYVLLKAIMLFAPNSSEMTPEAVEVVDAERAKYCSALHKLLKKELGDLEGTKKYAEVLTVSEAFVRFSDNRREKIEICSLMTTMTLSAIGQVVVLQRENPTLDTLRVVFESKAKIGDVQSNGSENE